MSDDILITSEHPEYFNVGKKRNEIDDFRPKVEKANKFVIDEYKEFFNRVQWIAGGAISLSVPLLTNSEKRVFSLIHYHNLYFTNIIFLSLSWVLFVFSFLFALYRNKIHPEYIQSETYVSWQKMNKEWVEIKSKIFPEEDSLKENITEIEGIQKENKKQAKKLWNKSEFFGKVSQGCLVCGIISFVIFGLMTLYL